MKKKFLFLCCFFCALTGWSRKTDEAFRVLQRVSKQSSVPVKLELKKGAGNMYYEYSVKDGVLHLKGSDNVSLCRGFYDYVKTHRPGMVGTWSLKPDESRELVFNIPARMLKGLKGISIECLKGSGRIECTGYVLEGDGQVVASSSDRVSSGQGKLHYTLEMPEKVNANNGCLLKLTLKSSGGNAAGIILGVNDL